MVAPLALAPPVDSDTVTVLKHIASTGAQLLELGGSAWAEIHGRLQRQQVHDPLQIAPAATRLSAARNLIFPSAS